METRVLARDVSPGETGERTTQGDPMGRIHAEEIGLAHIEAPEKSKDTS
ncbi:MAG TPA: hypothetical protein VKA68_13975 [bacterium]|nr:hypothetical protein [bacterium]